jgi:hypothetical protein
MGVTSDWDKAVVAQLQGNTALSDAVVGIYAGIAPQAADSGDPSAFPYLVIDDTDFVDYHTATESGFEVLMRIFTISRSPGRKQVRDVQDLLYAALHRQHAAMNAAGNVAGHTILFIDRDGSTVEEAIDADGSWRGVCEFRAIVTRNAAD